MRFKYLYFVFLSALINIFTAHKALAGLEGLVASSNCTVKSNDKLVASTGEITDSAVTISVALDSGLVRKFEFHIEGNSLILVDHGTDDSGKVNSISFLRGPRYTGLIFDGTTNVSITCESKTFAL